MLLPGLLIDSRARFNKNILNIKVNVFNFLNSIIYNNESLFPAISKASFPVLTTKGAVACAADDLELFTTNGFDFDFGLYRQNGAGTDEFRNEFDNNLLYPEMEKQKQEQYQPLDYELGVYSSSDGIISPLEDELSFKKRKFDSVSSESSDATNAGGKYETNAISYNYLAAYDVDHLFNDLINDLPEPYHPDQHPHQMCVIQPPILESMLHKMTRPAASVPHQRVEQFTLRSRPSVSKATSDNSSLKYKCAHCDARFKVKGYLTRHVKKHNTLKAFQCPFYLDHEKQSSGTKCHPTGGFSRRDTYKTHLKALHFIYPPGTKSSERSFISGRCAGCFQYFENNAKWLEDHIENGGCSGVTLDVRVKDELD